uniref:Uncharacterized protein n=1 Tax=Caenorhabditis tropicalis TaxID=1561998 RepID=A0A1I7UEY1_9PELO
MFVDGYTGVPLLTLLKMAVKKRTKAAAEKNQNLRLRTTNSKFARQIQHFIRTNEELFRQHQAEQEEKRLILIQQLQQAYKMENEAMNQEIKKDTEPTEPVEPKRPFRIPNILRRAHAKRISTALRKTKSTEV